MPQNQFLFQRFPTPNCDSQKWLNATSKYEDKHRKFFKDWEDTYFFDERKGKPFCLICDTALIFSAISVRSIQTLTRNSPKVLNFASANLIRGKCNGTAAHTGLG